MLATGIDIPRVFGGWPGLDEGLLSYLEQFAGRDAIVFVTVRLQPNELVECVSWHARYIFSSKRGSVRGKWLKVQFSQKSLEDYAADEQEMVEHLSGTRPEVEFHTHTHHMKSG
jgi:hypothetical protein